MSFYRCHTLFIASVLLLGTVLFPANRVEAQSCMYPTDLTAPVFCYDYMGPMVTKTERACFANLTYTMVGQYRNCTPSPYPTDTSNVDYCVYIMGQRRLFARRLPDDMGTPAHCQLMCDCGTLRVDDTDGLPVELMEFRIEDDRG